MLVKLVDFILEQSDKHAQKKRMQQTKERNEQERREREHAEAVFSQKARTLQPKFENSEFCDLIVKFILGNYYLKTLNSKDDEWEAKPITLYEDYIYICTGASLHFVDIKYQDLKDSIELMACAYAIESKLKQHWGNNLIVTHHHSSGGYGDSACVSIRAFKVEPLKKVY